MHDDPKPDLPDDGECLTPRKMSRLERLAWIIGPGLVMYYLPKLLDYLASHIGITVSWRQ